MRNSISDQINLCEKLIQLEQNEDWGQIVEDGNKLIDELRVEGYFANLIEYAKSWIKINNKVEKLHNSKNPNEFESTLALFLIQKDDPRFQNSQTIQLFEEKLKKIIRSNINYFQITNWDNYPNILKFLPKNQAKNYNIYQKANDLLHVPQPSSWLSKVDQIFKEVQFHDFSIDKSGEPLIRKLQNLYNNEISELRKFLPSEIPQKDINTNSSESDNNNFGSKRILRVTLIGQFFSLLLLIFLIFYLFTTITPGLNNQNELIVVSQPSVTNTTEIKIPTRTPTLFLLNTDTPIVLPTIKPYIVSNYQIVSSERNIPIYSGPEQSATQLYYLNISEFDVNFDPIQIILTQTGFDENNKLPITFSVLVKKEFVNIKLGTISTGIFLESAGDIYLFSYSKHNPSEMALWGSVLEEGKKIEFQILDSEETYDYYEISLSGWVDISGVEQIP